MSHETVHARLGQFVLKFQAVEAAMVELTVQLVDADPEYIATLTAELEFSAKARALDVIFARFAQLHQLTEASPHPEFHKLMTQVQSLATRRNDLVHSFYSLLVTVDGRVALARAPTKLKPSVGLRVQPTEDILVARFDNDLSEILGILQEIERYRLVAIDKLYPDVP